MSDAPFASEDEGEEPPEGFAEELEAPAAEDEDAPVDEDAPEEEEGEAEAEAEETSGLSRFSVASFI